MKTSTASKITSAKLFSLTKTTFLKNTSISNKTSILKRTTKQSVNPQHNVLSFSNPLVAVSGGVVSAVAALTLAMSSAHAAGLEYTKQSVLPFFEEGNYIEATYATVDMEIEGTDVASKNSGGALDDNHINDMMDDFDIFTAAIKIEPSEDTAFAILYDEPFGVDTIYPSGSEFQNSMGTTEARLDTRSLTFLGGGNATDNIIIYGGLEYQEAEGSVQLAQMFEGDPIYYDLQSNDTSEAIIPVVGMAFEIPEVMLRAALTWRGEGSHSLKANESLLVNNSTLNPSAPTNYNDIPIGVKDFLGLPNTEFSDTNLNFKSPQSVNFDFQTGLSEKYQLLGMVNARWVEWTTFEIAPEAITALTQEPLAEYFDDAYAIEVALGKQFTPQFAAEVRLGYDSGTGEPLSLLGPYDAFKSLALGGTYSFNDNFDISAGAQYMWFDGGKAYSKLPVTLTDEQRGIASFDDGTGLAVGAKIGYHF